MASWMKAAGSVAAGVGIFVAGYQYAAAWGMAKAVKAWRDALK